MDTGAEKFDPTPEFYLAKLVKALKARAPAWVAIPPKTRAALLRRCLDTCVNASRDAAEAEARNKGTYGGGIGEEWCACV